jgi:hypothetical protein
MWKKVVVAALSLSLGAMLLATSPVTVGQDNKEEKAEKKVRRLPAYYSDIVTGEQRQKIYDIQARYQEQISELTQQMLDLVKKQNDEIEAVLSAEQLVQLKKAQEDGAARKKKRAAEKKDAAKTAAKTEG